MVVQTKIWACLNLSCAPLLYPYPTTNLTFDPLQKYINRPYIKKMDRWSRRTASFVLFNNKCRYVAIYFSIFQYYWSFFYEWSHSLRFNFLGSRQVQYDEGNLYVYLNIRYCFPFVNILGRNTSFSPITCQLSWILTFPNFRVWNGGCFSRKIPWRLTLARLSRI